MFGFLWVLVVLVGNEAPAAQLVQKWSLRTVKPPSEWGE